MFPVGCACILLNTELLKHNIHIFFDVYKAWDLGKKLNELSPYKSI